MKANASYLNQIQALFFCQMFHLSNKWGIWDLVLERNYLEILVKFSELFRLSSRGCGKLDFFLFQNLSKFEVKKFLTFI